MTSWIYPANIKLYDVIGAFDQPETYWPRNSKVETGDSIYIYLAAPYKQIAYACDVLRTDLTGSSILEKVQPFFRMPVEDADPLKRFMQVRTKTRFELGENSPLSYKSLKENGLSGMLMGARKLENSPDLKAYIEGQVS